MSSFNEGVPIPRDISDGLSMLASTNSGGLDLDRFSDVVSRGAALPTLPMIFGTLVHEGDLCFLFGAPNCGKTPLAISMCEQYAGGTQMAHPLRCEASNGKSLFIDCELSERQQGNRYRGDNGLPYQFHKNVLRATLGKLTNEGDITQEILGAIEETTVNEGVGLVVLDNITALQAQTEKSFDSAKVIYALKKLTGDKVTVVVIAHTPKRDASKPTSISCMAGSAVYGNLADSVVSVMPSGKGKYIRRIQQHKSRNSNSCSVEYGSENNLIIESAKRGDGLIAFEVIGTAPEYEHLPVEQSRDEVTNSILQAIQDHPEWSDRAIASLTGSNHPRVGRIRRSVHSGTSGTCGTGVPNVPAYRRDDPFEMFEQ